MQNQEPTPQYATEEYSMTLSAASTLVAKDEGNYYEAEIKGNKFDVIGYEEFGGGFASIKKKSYGDYEYNGMVYNRSIINGLASLSVNFSGGDLYYVFSDYLMEDMNFDKANQLESNHKVNAPVGSGYFIVYTDSEDPVDIKELTVSYLCDQSLDNSMIYNESNITSYARSTPTKNSEKFYSDSFEFTNRPDKDINNYSTGTNSSSGRKKSWYRWNGRTSTVNSGELGNSFAIDTTIMGNISQAIDPSSYFNFSMWINIGYGDGTGNKETWEYVYIGNDNYEPLGYEDSIFPTKGSDPYLKDTYSGRFINRYVYDENRTDCDGWIFDNPYTGTVADGSMTLKEAYDAFSLPYWHLSYRIDKGYFYCYVNGIRIYEEEMFDENYNNDSIFIKRVDFHAVNYGAGVDEAGTPYNAFFTYPRLTTPCPDDLNEIYLRGGSDDDWSLKYDRRFKKTNENRGELLNVHLEQNGIYNIGNGDWSEKYGFNKFSDDPNTSYSNFSGGEEDNFVCNVEGDYNFYVNYAGEVYVYRDINSVPLYLRGSFNSWGTDDELDPSADPNNVGELLNVVLHAGDEFKIAEDDWTGKFVYGYESLNKSCESYANFSDYGGNIHCNVSGAYNLYLTTNEYIYITAGDAFYIEQESLTLTKGHTATIHYGNNTGNVSVSGDNTVASWSVDSENKTISFTALKGATDEPYQVFDGSETLYFTLSVTEADTWSVYFESKDYFNHAGNSEEVYIYAWNNEDKNAEWPGEVMTWVKDLDDGKKIFTFELANEYTSIVIVKVDNNGNVKMQTQDIDLSTKGDDNCVYLAWDSAYEGAIIDTGWYTYNPV